jgi:hypothetical protein
MASQAKITSIETLENFRAQLILFASKTHCALDEVHDEVRRTRNWVQTDRRTHWEGEVRRRKRILDQAEQELFSARMSVLKNNNTLQQAAVRKARAALEEGEAKLRNVKKWNKCFDNAADPLVKSMEGFRHYLDQSTPKAISYLLQAQKTLESYAQTPLPDASPSSPEPGGSL